MNVVVVPHKQFVSFGHQVIYKQGTLIQLRLVHLRFVLTPMHGLSTFLTRWVLRSKTPLENLDLQFLSPQHFETTEFFHLAFHFLLLAFVLMHFDLPVFVWEASKCLVRMLHTECRQHFTMLFTFWDLGVSNPTYLNDSKFQFMSSQTSDTTNSTPLFSARPLFSILWINKYPKRINEGQIFGLSAFFSH